MATSPPCLTVDATVLVALCAGESDKFHVADAEMERYSRSGSRFYAPGVIVAETLYVLCKKLKDGILSAPQHADAIYALSVYMTMIEPPPNGDRSLVRRSEEIRSTYGCSRSADAIYIALTEELAAVATAELLTFDAGFLNQAMKSAPTVAVRLLIPAQHP